MTLPELQAKRDEILKSLGYAAIRNGDQSLEYQEQEAALRIIDAQIAKVSVPTSAKTTLVQHDRG